MEKNIWTIDLVHSEILFKVRHMMITNVTGTFDRFEATLYSSEA
ncbi:MAG: YceI family protein [Bacteroidetes bacterium]|nr:YceI family protein [Bacteroidota bacterium]